MATLDEIYQKALADEGERAELAQAAADPQALAEFLAARGCDATPDEALAFAQGKLSETGELSSEELAAVAGGWSPVTLTPPPMPPESKSTC